MTTQPAETTGSHAVQTPNSNSDPPIHARGVSWKTVAAVLGFVGAIAIPTATGLVGFGRVLAEQDDLAEEVRELRLEVRTLSRAITNNRERIVLLERDVGRHERELDQMHRRGAPTRER